MVDPAQSHDQPFVAFVPDLRRFLIAELWAVLVAIAASAIVMYLSRGTDYLPSLIAVASGVLIAIFTTFARRSRRITIGDTWISGPTHDAFGSAVISFDRVDWARSGFRRGWLRLKSTSGYGISAKTSWYAPEDIAEIKRLVRDRCLTAQLPAEFY